MRMPRSLPLWLGLLLSSPGLARAQAPAPGGAPAPAQTPAPASSPALPKAAGPADTLPDGSTRLLDLAHRYRFSERYADRAEQASPGVIGPYRVTSSETFKDTGDAAEAGAKAEGTTRDVEYAERAGDVSGLGSVTATVRTYNSFRSRPEEPAPSVGGRLLNGLTVWYRPQREAMPLVISLDGRRLREREYELAAHQVFVPALAGLLPTQSVRIGDTWRVPRKAVQALLAEPEVRGDALRGKFVELRRPASGAGLQAVFSITGTIETQLAETRINAELLFSFTPPKPAAPDPARKAALPAGDEALIDVDGAISRLLMARVAQGVIGGGTSGQAQPRKFRVEQQLILDRHLGGPGPAVRNDLPTSTPAATVANSWLTYADPQGQFNFQHPQDLLPPPQGQPEANSLFLTRGSADGRDRDLLQIDLFGTPREPDALKDILQSRWDRMQAEVVRGDEGWLPASEWSGMKVFRIEAAAKTATARGGRSTRLHFDAYLIKFNERSCAIAIATTTRDAVPSFRREIEQVLKTFRPPTGG